MKELRLVLVGLLFLSTSACASKTRWYLNGASEAKFHQDDAICQSYASQTYSAQGARSIGEGAGSGSGELAALGGLMSALEISKVNTGYIQCMQARGYTKAN